MNTQNQDNLDKPAIMSELAAAIMRTIRDSNAPISTGMASLSMALIIACRTIGISREDLKTQILRDIDHLYDQPKPPMQ